MIEDIGRIKARYKEVRKQNNSYVFPGVFHVNDVGVLLAEIGRLTTERDGAREDYEGLLTNHRMIVAERDNLRKVAAELVAAITPFAVDDGYGCKISASQCRAAALAVASAARRLENKQ